MWLAREGYDDGDDEDGVVIYSSIKAHHLRCFDDGVFLSTIIPRKRRGPGGGVKADLKEAKA